MLSFLSPHPPPAVLSPGEVLSRVAEMLSRGVEVDGKLYVVKGRFNKAIKLRPWGEFTATFARGCLSVVVDGFVEGGEVRIASVSYAAGQG